MNGIDRPQQRWEFVAEDLPQGGKAGRGPLYHRAQAFEEGLRFRRQLRERDQGRRQFFGRRFVLYAPFYAAHAGDRRV